MGEVGDQKAMNFVSNLEREGIVIQLLVTIKPFLIMLCSLRRQVKRVLRKWLTSIVKRICKDIEI